MKMLVRLSVTWVARVPTAVAVMCFTLAGPAWGEQSRAQEVVTFGGLNGSQPVSGLTVGPDGNLYGVTPAGGEQRAGVVYRLSPAGDFHVVHQFGGSYYEPAHPRAGLTLGIDGKLYGTTETGGFPRGRGSVFRIGTDSAIQYLHSFNPDDYRDGFGHIAALVQGADGQFYGTTTSGAVGLGTLYRVSDFGYYTHLRDFVPAIGAVDPRARLIKTSDGRLLGTTLQGGAHGKGTVYQVSGGNQISVLHSFSGSKTPSTNSAGCDPQTGLTLGPDGRFWGLAGCGEFGAGVLYRISGDGAYQTVRSLRPNGALGYTQFSSLTVLPDGRFIATSQSGGRHGHGTVFTIDREGETTVLHAFPEYPSDGQSPSSALTCLGDQCWGTTQFGGRFNQGVVYRLKP
jgi:uncharacterized repeat protein (TIGR03803 family)